MKPLAVVFLQQRNNKHSVAALAGALESVEDRLGLTVWFARPRQVIDRLSQAAAIHRQVVLAWSFHTPMFCRWRRPCGTFVNGRRRTAGRCSHSPAGRTLRVIRPGRCGWASTTCCAARQKPASCTSWRRWPPAAATEYAGAWLAGQRRVLSESAPAARQPGSLSSVRRPSQPVRAHRDQPRLPLSLRILSDTGVARPADAPSKS